jgi:ABC-type multidrug transport system ATPase subunit
MMKELSGGNKRKLSIAIAIIGHPKVLIFDEPTSGLDPLSRMHVWDIFSSLREMRSTIILTTHHLDEAEKLSDWVCVIERGSVIVENTAQQIK